MNEDEKAATIKSLRDELAAEIDRENKFEALREELLMLDKNYRLEVELQKSEFENRKL